MVAGRINPQTEINLPFLTAVGGGSVVDPTSDAWSYIGIPYPTDTTTELTSLGYREFPYDPCTIPVPDQPASWPAAETAGFYYIDSTHGSATDTANTYGYPDTPRKTIPEGFLAAGAVVEIHGGPYVASGDRFDWHCAGTSSQPVFITSRGDVNRPHLNEFIHLGLNGKVDHLIIEGIQLNVGYFDIRSTFGTAEYITLRHLDIIGDLTPQKDAVNVAAVTNLMVYDVLCHDIDDWDSPTQVDNGFVSLAGASNVWIIETTSYRTGGDGVLAGHTSRQNDGFLFVGGNVWSEHNENCVDIKEIHDIIISGNDFHTIVTFGSQDPGAVVAAHGGSGGATYSAKNMWVIGNRIYDSGQGINSTQDAEVFAIGNEFWNLDSQWGSEPSAGYAMNSRGESGCFVDNTVYDCGGGLSVEQSNVSLPVTGNIFAERDALKATGSYGSHDLYAGNSLAYPTAPDYNLFTSRSVSGTFPVGIDANSQYDVAHGMTDPANDDFTLKASSDAVGNNTVSSVYATFLTRYGIDIEVDIAGNTRPSSGRDIGAHER